MAKFTLHNENGDYMHEWASTLNGAKTKADNSTYKCKVMETYYAKSAWRPWDETKVECGKLVYQNY